jgi:multidrug efflux pump subunit AcrA (membrane-fusion protein)
MRRRTLILIILVALALAGYLGYTQVYAPSSAPTPTPAAAANSETVIWASGEVLPVKWASLGFPIGGQVVELPVAEGTTVAAGTILARLDAGELEDAVSVAQASLTAARAELARLKASARPASVAQAEAEVRSAQATRDGAQAQLEQAQAELAGLLAGAKSEEVDAAAATLMKAEAALRLAQTEYDKIAWAGDVGQSPQALTLQSATLDYNVARSNYQALVKGARSQEIDAARAAVSAAQAGVSQAQAGVDAAQAALDLVRAGATAEEIAAAEAAVAEAEANLASAQTALSRATLVAPFDGTLSEVYVRTGEQVIPGQAVLALGDLAAMQVKVTDLRETDVARIAVGQPVDITFDALPNTLLKGHVVYISAKSTSKEGGVNYPTTVEFDQFDPRIRWGMTAYVNITVN